MKAIKLSVPNFVFALFSVPLQYSLILILSSESYFKFIYQFRFRSIDVIVVDFANSLIETIDGKENISKQKNWDNRSKDKLYSYWLKLSIISELQYNNQIMAMRRRQPWPLLSGPLDLIQHMLYAV